VIHAPVLAHTHFLALQTKLGGATKSLPEVVETCVINQNLSKLHEEYSRCVCQTIQATGLQIRSMQMLGVCSGLQMVSVWIWS